MTYAAQFAAPNHWLFLLACGAVVNNGTASDDLQKTLKDWEVPYTFGFTAKSFNAHLASVFIAQFATRIIIKNADLSEHSLCHLLDLCYNLCRHGSLLLFCSKPNVAWILREEYKWHHHKLQPGGIPLPMQCACCKCIGCLKSFYSEDDGVRRAGFRCIHEGCRWYKQAVVTYKADQLHSYHGNWFKV